MPDKKPPLLNLDINKCIQCYACVRICPVKAIEIKGDEEFPNILHNRCIGCGSCMDVCSPYAITYFDSKEAVKKLIASKSKVAAIADPAISGEFVDITDYRKFVGMIRALGFDYVNEVSFGVDLVAMKYKELITQSKGKFYITSNCPSVVSTVQKFHPEIIENLAPIVSPMVATAKVVRKKYGKDLKVVFIGPCVEAKQNAKEYNDDGKIDEVLTFEELRQLFEESKITEKALEYSDFDPPIGYKGSLYPVSEGIMESIDSDGQLLNSEVVTLEGKDDMLNSIEEFKSNSEDINKHFNMFYCEGCIMGPGTSPNGKKLLRRSMVLKYANKRLKDFDIETWFKEIKIYKDLDLSRKIEPDDQRLPYPSKEKIREVLKVIGRDENEEDAGCTSCGYRSCRDFAVAVSKGLAKPEMCLTYNLKNKKEYINTLRITNEKLAQAQEALKQSEQVARKEQQTAKEASERAMALMQRLPSGVLIVDEKLKIVQSNETFIEMLGDDAKDINEIIPGLAGADLKTLIPFDFHKIFSFVLEKNEQVQSRDVHFKENLFNVSVFPIKKNKLVGAIIRDMYLPEVRKEEVINRVSEVINQNLEMVQQIGFLLGEGASKTEKMLNSVIESHQSGKKGDKK